MGLQNSALAIFIATQVLQSQEIALVSILYSSFSFFTTFLAAWLLKHYFRYGRPSAKSGPGQLE
jgi:BASS family bile acid:Na+ symporter